MIADAATVDRSAFGRAFDVCVIGAGPAGITLARRLAAAGAEVALMEAGGLEITPESQDVYVGENRRPRLFRARHRAAALLRRHLEPLGAAGAARSTRRLRAQALQPAERLADRPASTSTPTARETDAILDIPSATRGAGPADSRSPATTSAASSSAGARRPASARSTAPRSPPPTRIRLVLNANLVDLRLDDDLGARRRARSSAPTPRTIPGFTVRARAYCLCTGGIENPRLLLNFRSQAPEGIGNRHGVVGRYFCEHPHFVLADVLLRASRCREREFYAPTEQLHRRARVPELRHAARARNWRRRRAARAARASARGAVRAAAARGACAPSPPPTAPARRRRACAAAGPDRRCCASPTSRR